jgi:tetratricopeptide (TPR) repeat protein
MQPYTPEFAAQHLRPQKEEIAIGQNRYQAEIQTGRGWVVERGSEGTRRLPMVHVLGGKNVYYFLTPADRGRLQTLPVAYDLRRQEWFDTAKSGMRHFSEQVEGESLHWTDREYTFNTSCYSCHVSQLSTNYDLNSDTYHTVWAEPGINCEACHGPGAEHVRLCREAPEGKPPADLKIISTRSFNAEQTNAMCAPCHAQMVPVTASFLPGKRYFDHYDLTTLEDPDFYADGRDLGENYTYTLWRMNPCARSGKMDCMHCHTSSGRFRFKDEPNRSCLPCHERRVENAAAHTHHPPDSEGNLCIRCHMPMTEFARMRRSDHSLLPPTPAATIAFQSPNACNICHTDKDAAWADRFVREWRTRDYQAPVLHRAGLIDAGRKGDWSRLPEVLAYLSKPDAEEVYVTSLIRLLRSCDDERKWPAIIRSLAHPSPLVRAAAAEALDGYLTAESLPPLLKATRDEFRLVRVRAAASLGSVPQAWLDDGQQKALQAATAEFMTAMQVRPDDYTSHYNLGNFHAERGAYDQAIACYMTATKLQPLDIAPLVNASMAYNAMGRNEEAERSLRKALKLEPTSLAANLNLGLLLGEMGRPKEAEAALRAAFAADAKCATAAFNLAVILANENPEESLGWCRKAATLQPDNPRYAYTLGFYLHQAGQADAAKSTLRALLDEHPDYADGYGLLGDILEQEGRLKEAGEVYRRAAHTESLPPRVRAFFETKWRALSAP